MRVNVWGINYAPELTGIAPYNTALCKFLLEEHHEVRMVTTFPYYPSWSKLPEDRRKLYRTDLLDGVKVHRCWHFVVRRMTTLRRIIHEASFVATSLLRQLWLPRPDIYVVVSPPLLLGFAAWVVSKIKRAPFVFHVQDLQPDAAAGLDMLKRGWFLRALYWLEGLAYAKASRVSGIMPAMIEAFRRKGVAEPKRVLFPNGVVLPDLSQAPLRGRFRERWNFTDEDFLVIYSGNLGVKQGLPVLVEAARELKNPRLRLVICGEGSQRDSLQALISQGKLANVTLLPLQPEERYREMLIDADICVITQQPGSGAFFFPSKLLTTLSWAKPVLTVADEESELVRALQAGGFGINVPPTNVASLVAVLETLPQDRALLERYGRAGRQYVEQFAMDKVLRDFTAELYAVVREFNKPSRAETGSATQSEG